MGPKNEEQIYTDIQTRLVRFFVEGVPQAFTRQIAVNAALRASGRSKARGSAIPAKLREWRDTIQLLYLAAVMEADPKYEAFPRSGEFTGPVELSIVIWGSQADGTNVLKEIEDALNFVAYPDDRVIVKGGFAFGDRMLSERGGLLRNVTCVRQGVDISVQFR
jgi:hypothetical protein